MQRREINAPDAPAPVGAYTHAIEVTGASRTVYVSGQVGMDAHGNIPDDLAAQCRLVWANIAAQLRACGMGYDNIVKVVTIITDHAHLAESRKARAEAMGERKPASTLIIGGLANPSFKIEIEVVACA